MTVLAAEAGATAVQGEAAAATTSGAAATSPRPAGPTTQGTSRAAPRQGGRTSQGSRRSTGPVPRRGGRTQQGARARPRTGGRTQQGTSGGRRASTAAPKKPAAQGGSQRRKGGNRKQPPVVRFPGSGRSGTNYESVILGEFFLAVFLVAATPFAKKNQAGVSPYAGRDMVQLLSLTLLYFLLALLAGTGGQRARFAAWFGGLILLTVGLGEAATIAKAVTTFFGVGPAQQSSDQVDNPDITAGVASAAENALGPAAGISRTVAQDPRTTGASN